MKYKKKPVVVEAVQYLDENPFPVMNFLIVGLTLSDMDRHYHVEVEDDEEVLYIKTLEGEMRVNNRDWIIKGVAGEFYSCKPDIFEATYDQVL